LNVKEVNLEQYSISADKKLIGNVESYHKDLITFINVVDYLVNSLNKKMSSFQIENLLLTAELKSIVKEKKLESYIVFLQIKCML
jgi:hypothetical protein